MKLDDEGVRDQLIAELYEGVLAPDLLKTVTSVIGRLVDVDSTGAWVERDGQIQEIILGEDLVETTDAYLNYYAALDPWRLLGRVAPGQVELGSDIVPAADLARTEFFNDFARPVGLVQPMGVLIESEPGSVVNLALHRDSRHRLLDGDDKNRLQRFVPHLRNVMRIRERLGATATHDWGSAALDALAFGAVVCDQDGRVLFANRMAGDLEREGLVRISGRHLTLCTRGLAATAANERLARAIRDGSRGVGGTVRARCGSDIFVAALIGPLPSQLDGFLRAGLVMVSLIREDRAQTVACDRLRSLYGLSPAQAHLCLSLLAGDTFEEAAAKRGVATSTMRTHFATVLERTNTENLRDLLSLLTSLPQVR